MHPCHPELVEGLGGRGAEYVEQGFGGGDGGVRSGAEVPAVRGAFADEVRDAANLDRRDAGERGGAQHGEAFHRLDVGAEAVREDERARGRAGDDRRGDAAADDHRNEPLQERTQQSCIGFDGAHELLPVGKRERRAVFQSEFHVVFARADDRVADRAALAKSAGDAGVDDGVVVLRREGARGPEPGFDRADTDCDDVDVLSRGERRQLLRYRADDEDADGGTRWLATQSGPMSRWTRLVRNAGALPSYAWPTNWKIQPTTNAPIAHGHVTYAATM